MPAASCRSMRRATKCSASAPIGASRTRQARSITRSSWWRTSRRRSKTARAKASPSRASTRTASPTPVPSAPRVRRASSNARARHELFLARGARLAGVGEAVRVDARHRDAFARAVLEHALDVLDHDERMVDLAGCIGQAPIRALAEHFVAGRIDWHDAAGVAVLAQIALRARRVLARVTGRADQSDRARREQRLR